MAENTVVTVTPPALRRGTHVLSWRVVSADGHPVGGSLRLLGRRGDSGAGAGAHCPPAIRSSAAALWAAKLVIYAALFIGIGGAFFRAWMLAIGSPWLAHADGADRAGLFVDAALGRAAGARCARSAAVGTCAEAAWEAGFDTSYGLTAIARHVALFAALFAFDARARQSRTALLVARVARRRRLRWR